MGNTATISYSSLKQASSEADQVAKKLDRYANNLNSAICRKLNNYNGDHTGNISSAIGQTNEKISELYHKSQAYRKYASDLKDLRSKCESVDKSVRTRVSQLTASFKSANGIGNNKVENTINYILTGLSNSTVVGRWLGNTLDNADAGIHYFKQCIEDWWDYDGGKEVIKGGVIAVLETVGAVCAVIAGVAALIAGGTVFAMIAAVAGVVAGVIAAVNGITNLVNEGRAYNETHNNSDPALGRRRSGEDTIQDTLRRETDSKELHGIATGIDIVNGVCTVISFVNGIGNLAKNAYKWTTGSMADIKNLKIKDILTKSNFNDFIGKVKTSFSSGFSEITSAVKLRDFTIVKKFAMDFRSDFIINLREFKKDYTNFETFKDGAKSIKNWASITKTLVSGDFSPDTVFVDGLLKTVVLPNIGLAKLVTYAPTNENSGGVFAYEDSFISITEIPDQISSATDIFRSGKDLTDHLFGGGDIIDKNLLNKLGKCCDFSVSVPKIHIPKINIPHVDAPAI